jgi:hypothetical protein
MFFLIHLLFTQLMMLKKILRMVGLLVFSSCVSQQIGADYADSSHVRIYLGIERVKLINLV